MKLNQLPNLISLLRILLVIPVVYTLVKEQYAIALLLFLVAGVSDGVDGFLARQFDWQTRLGAILDPIGDKLLLVSVFIVLGWLGHLPVLLVMWVIARDIIIVSGAVLYHLLIEEVPIRPVFISKVNTAAQLLLVLVVILRLADLPLSSLIPAMSIESLIVLVYVTTISSGIVYVWQWGRRAVYSSHTRGDNRHE